MGKEVPAPALVPLFEQVHAAVVGSPPEKRPLLSFYSYVSTKTTLRDRDGRYVMRLSDHMKDAPDEVIRGVMAVLLCRVRRVSESRADSGDVAAYQAWIYGDKASDRRATSREKRGRKHIDPIGDHRSLLESYLRVSMEMDLLLPEAPKLSWSKTRSTRRFGHQDSDHGVIVLSRALDDPEVPMFVLDFVVYHELLHIVHPPRMGGGRKRMVHPPEFKAAERKFAQRQAAEDWLSALASGRKRPRRKMLG
jgi:hypothetical protein